MSANVTMHDAARTAPARPSTIPALCIAPISTGAGTPALERTLAGRKISTSPIKSVEYVRARANTNMSGVARRDQNHVRDRCAAGDRYLGVITAQRMMNDHLAIEMSQLHCRP